MSIAARARFWSTPLTADEAGASLAAQSWASGGTLYTDLFIDRPQGLVILYQRWEAVVGPAATSVRLLATAAGVVLIVATAVAARSLSRSAPVGVAAATLAAVLSSSPAIEGHTANAELLAAAVGASAAAVAAPAVSRAGPASLVRWSVAGALGALAITVKQSAFDVLVALGAWLAVAAWRQWRPRRQVVWAAIALAGGAAVVGAVTLAHGATLGWDAYRYALYDFRLDVRSTVAGARWSRLAATSAIVGVLIGPAVALTISHLRSLDRPWRHQLDRPTGFVVAWAGAGAAGLLAGGNYHRHYWVQLVPPLSIGLAMALAAGRDRELARPSPQLVGRLAAAVALPLVVTAALVAVPSIERSDTIDTDVEVADRYLGLRRDADAELVVLCGGATTYATAEVVPAYPYLWVDHVRWARGARSQLRDLLDGASRPAHVAVRAPLSACDPDGEVHRVLERRYQPTATVGDVTVWTARGQ